MKKVRPRASSTIPGMLERVASAKINLALHVTGQRDDGYHCLDTLVVFTEFGDVVRVVGQATPTGFPVALKTSGPFAKDLPASQDNLVYRAALLILDFVSQRGIEHQPVTIDLEKNLPASSGIGGGSSDAAATLGLLKEFWAPDMEIDLEELSRPLGADLPMCLLSRPLRAQGTGDKVTFPTKQTVFDMVLVNPGVAVSTPAVFTKLQYKTNPPLDIAGTDWSLDLAMLMPLRNDLADAAAQLHPEILSVLQVLRETGCSLARMSGTGATCFGLYRDANSAKKAAEKIAAIRPDWWCVATRSTNQP